MATQTEILNILSRLKQLCPAGYSAALHFGFHAPRFLFQSYPQEWRDEYTRESLILADPALRWGLENQGLMRWSDIPGADTNVVFEKARAFGVNFGFTFATGLPGAPSVFNGAREDRAPTDDEIKQACELFDQLHTLTSDLQSLDPEVSKLLLAQSIALTHGNKS